MAVSETTTSTSETSLQPADTDSASLTRSGRDFKFVARHLQRAVNSIRLQKVTPSARSRKRARQHSDVESTLSKNSEKPRRSPRIAGLAPDGIRLADGWDFLKSLEWKLKKEERAKKPAKDSKNGFTNASDHSASKRVKKAAVPLDASNEVPEPTREDVLEHTSRECLTCLESLPLAEGVELPCAHTYCSDCFVTLVRHAIADEASFPPRCCDKQAIARTILHQSAPAEIWETFKRKEAEYAVPVTKRIYCSRATCSRFLDPKLVSNDVVTCRTCKQRTCTICKGKAHGKRECPEDKATAQVLGMAELKGWKRCPSCRSVVARLYGCNHMRESTPNVFARLNSAMDVVRLAVSVAESVGDQWVALRDRCEPLSGAWTGNI
ncbi:IBR domain, a half RING-finger domain-containing protein [Sarocladium implicatum]|nr:IBR domain, a half RING-finger domain-containing protein [Sarocladium implicatum]